VVHSAIKLVTETTGGITPASIQALEYEQLKELLRSVHRNKQKAKYVLDCAATTFHQLG
jgi:endonuclease III